MATTTIEVTTSGEVLASIGCCLTTEGFAFTLPSNDAPVQLKMLALLRNAIVDRVTAGLITKGTTEYNVPTV